MNNSAKNTTNANIDFVGIGVYSCDFAKDMPCPMTPEEAIIDAMGDTVFRDHGYNHDLIDHEGTGTPYDNERVAARVYFSDNVNAVLISGRAR